MNVHKEKKHNPEKKILNNCVLKPVHSAKIKVPILEFNPCFLKPENSMFLQFFTSRLYGNADDNLMKSGIYQIVILD